jgi:hypothetical protein
VDQSAVTGEVIMKKLILFVAIAAALTAAAPAKKKTKTAPAPAPQAVTIPKDAVLNADGNTYSWTDKSGKKWIYAKTPFGIIKSPVADAAAADQATAIPTGTKVIDKGDSVRFERQTPFGVTGWEKKKTELTDSERQLVDAQKAPQQ